MEQEELKNTNHNLKIISDGLLKAHGENALQLVLWFKAFLNNPTKLKGFAESLEKNKDTKAVPDFIEKNEDAV